jgi:hypothetical protein
VAGILLIRARFIPPPEAPPPHVAVRKNIDKVTIPNYPSPVVHGECAPPLRSSRRLKSPLFRQEKTSMQTPAAQNRTASLAKTDPCPSAKEQASRGTPHFPRRSDSVKPSQTRSNQNKKHPLPPTRQKQPIPQPALVAPRSVRSSAQAPKPRRRRNSAVQNPQSAILTPRLCAFSRNFACFRAHFFPPPPPPPPRAMQNYVS